MQTIDEVCRFLSEHAVKNAPGTWIKAVIEIKVQPKFSSYNGFYTTDSGNHNMSVFDFPIETGDYITHLNLVTTPKGDNKWNKATLAVTPDNRYEIEYFWDQEWQDHIDRLNREEEQKDPDYKAPKWHWEEQG